LASTPSAEYFNTPERALYLHRNSPHNIGWLPPDTNVLACHSDGKPYGLAMDTALKMTDFKIQPPASTIALGAIKTGDEVKISFGWILRPKTAATAK
jgi:hypothetical protein